MAFDNPIVGGTALRIPAIQSPDYAPGTAGWIVRIDGSAEFNNVTIRGGVVVSGVSLYYNGTPAAGNLVMSIAETAGTDSFGNAYLAGLTVYATDGSGRYSQLQTNGEIAIGYTSVFENAGEIIAIGTGMRIVTPYTNTAPNDDPLHFTLLPGGKTGTDRGFVSIGTLNGRDIGSQFLGTFTVITQETASNGVVVDAVSGTTGKLTSWRVNGTEKAAVNSAGSISAANMDWGSGSAVLNAAASVDVTVTFSKTFPNVPTVTATLSNSPTLPAGSTALTCRVFGVSTTGCTIRVSDVGAVNRTLTIGVDWHAISS